MTHKKFLLIIIILIILSLLPLYFNIYGTKDSTIAEVYSSGELIKTIDLSKIKDPYTFDITSEYGKNTILAEKDKITVTDSDCPDKVCVQRGSLTTDNAADTSYSTPIVCLPHKLVIQIRN